MYLCWVSLVLLIVIIGAMSGMGSRYYGGARKAAGLPYFECGRNQPPLETIDPAAVEALLQKANPALLTLIGYGGFAIITWLMMFKPF